MIKVIDGFCLDFDTLQALTLHLQGSLNCVFCLTFDEEQQGTSADSRVGAEYMEEVGESIGSNTEVGLGDRSVLISEVNTVAADNGEAVFARCIEPWNDVFGYVPVAQKAKAYQWRRR